MARTFVGSLDEPTINDTSLTCRAGVFGLPLYLTPFGEVALKYTLSMFGYVKVERVMGGSASISYDNPETLRRALAASGKINFHGYFLTLVAKYIRRKYFEYTFNTLGESYVDPKCLDFRGNINQQILYMKNFITFDNKDVLAFAGIARDLQILMRRGWRECRVHLYGSMITGLHTVSSDVDIYIYIPRDVSNEYRISKTESIFRSETNVFLNLQIMDAEPLPTFRFFHIPTNIYCNVSLKSYLCVYTTRLTKFMLSLNQSLRPAALIIKYWAKLQGLSGKGQLSSYALIVLFIFYLQQPPCYVPSIVRLQRICHSDIIVDNWNVSFMDQCESVPRYTQPIWIPDLVGGFFAFYANFDFNNFVVCPFLGRVMQKIDFASLDALPAEFDRYKDNVASSIENPLDYNAPVVIQDVFELNDNLSRGLPESFVRKFQEFCKNGFESYNVGKLNRHRQFLKAILCEKPLIPEIRDVGDFVSVENVYKSFEDDVASWRLIMIESLIMIMRDICRIIIYKVDESRSNSSRIDTFFIGLVNKQVWNRPVRTSHPPGFLLSERFQSQMIYFDGQEAYAHFGLHVWYHRGTNCLNFRLSYVMGNVTDFMTFGVFFQNTILKWVEHYMCPEEE